MKDIRINDIVYLKKFVVINGVHHLNKTNFEPYIVIGINQKMSKYGCYNTYTITLKNKYEETQKTYFRCLSKLNKLQKTNVENIKGFKQIVFNDDELYKDLTYLGVFVSNNIKDYKYKISYSSTKLSLINNIIKKTCVNEKNIELINPTKEQITLYLLKNKI